MPADMNDIEPNSIPDFLLIGELAQRTGSNPKTIRFYEREGLLVPARHGRFRIYSRSDELRLKAILEMRRMGLHIAQIRTVLGKSPDAQGSMQTSYFAALLNKHLEELGQRQQEIENQIREARIALEHLNVENAG
jgi:DNA-binding transcriptional MerR regulator